MSSLGDAVAAQMLLDALSKIDRILAGQTELKELIVAKASEVIDQIGTAFAGVESDIERVLAALAAEQDLSEETQAAADALRTRITNVDAALDAAVPPVEPTEPII